VVEYNIVCISNFLVISRHATHAPNCSSHHSWLNRADVNALVHTSKLRTKSIVQGEVQYVC